MVDEVSVQPSDPEAGWLADEPDVAAPRRRNARGTAPNCWVFKDQHASGATS